MEERVWKYDLRMVEADQDIEMPKGAKILSARRQGSTVRVWALVNPAAEDTKTRTLIIAGTGWPITRYASDELVFIDTILEGGGELVWHVFEVRERRPN